MADPSCVLPLPTSLVLLLHLHILSYPKCNSAEYSSVTLFAHHRPLRDRTKTMERFKDIVAFLIEKIEGKEKRKLILGGTYPCLQPSDTVAFRVNVTKYLETLRTAVTRPSLQGSTSKGRIPTDKTFPPSSQLSSGGRSPYSSPQENSSPIAWWWSAIVVRKSLLEECSGDRFEKLLLALSTHALFVQVPFSSSLHPPNMPTISELANGLRIQSQQYASLLSRTFELHTARVQSVSRLNMRIQELISLRARLLLAPEATERVHTQRLLAMRDSKRQDLIEAWQTIPHDDSLGTIEHSMTASDALMWILSIAGISTSDTQHEEPSSSAGAFPPTAPSSDSVNVQSLPTASAHHPINMRKLRSLPSFVSLHPDLSVDRLTGASDAGSSLNSPALEELFQGASVQITALKAALDSAVTAGNDIAKRLDLALQSASGIQEEHMDNVSRQLDLWTPSNKNTASDAKDPSVLAFLNGLDVSPSLPDDIHIQQRIEASVVAVRESLLPRIPSPCISDADLSHSPESPQQATPIATTKQSLSAMPLASAPDYSQFGMSATESSHMISMTPKQSPRPYETSTPPPKSHPKSARAVRVASASDTDDVLLTPADNRDCSAVGSATVKASLPREMIADMSLPEFSDGDMTDLGIIPPQQSLATDREWRLEHVPEFGEEDMSYEGHSVTLRDILLRAGNGEDSFHLIDDLQGLDDGLGNETIGWG